MKRGCAMVNCTPKVLCITFRVQFIIFLADKYKNMSLQI